MKMEMTNRDKKLLVFLAVFVIVVGFGYWGVRPQIKAINEIELEKAAAKDLQSINDMKIAMLPMARDENAMLEEKLVEVRKNFYEMMESDEIDKHFTEMALDYGLNVYSLDIQMSDEEAKSTPYIYSEKFLNADLHEEEGYVEAEGSTTDVESVDNYARTGYTDLYDDEVDAATGIYAATVSLRLEGGQDSLQRLIDDLSASGKNHLLKSYSWSEGSGMVRNEDGEYEAMEHTFLDIVIDIYQCEA